MKRSSSLPSDTVVRTGAILIVDQCGFTRTVLEHGAAAGLERIYAMRRHLIPVLTDAGGEVFKVEADNLFGYFDSATDALAGALEAHATLAALGRKKFHRPPLAVGIGIGFGELLYLPSEDDYYGPEVNLAAKIGEDVAEGGETFLTESAVAELAKDPPGRGGRWRRVKISHVKIRYREWFAK